MTNVFFDKAKNIQNFSVNGTLKKFFALPEIQSWIIDTIQNRLYDRGEDNENKPLQTDKAKFERQISYSKYTQKRKSDKGQRTQNVTLKDTEKFYNSFKLHADLIFAEIKANFKKDKNNISENFEYSYNTQKDFETAILSLTDNELQLLIDNQMKTFVLFELRKYV